MAEPSAGMPGRTVPRSAVVAAVSIALLAAATTIFEIGLKSMWHDEVFSVQTASGGWRHLLSIIDGHEVNMALYYAMLHVWLNLGSDETTVRLLSALFAIAAAVSVYVLGRELFGPRIALMAGSSR